MTPEDDRSAPASGPAAGARASRRDWISLAVLALPCLVYAMDLTVLNLALPRISETMQPSAAQLLWIVDIYGFFVAGFLITMGNVGDRFGRRRVLLIGAVAFALASILAALANDATTLILARALLGMAGATIAPSTLSLIRNIFHDPGQRQFAIGIWITAFSVGGAIGPVVGGAILEYWDWHAIFLLAVPVMLGVLVLGPLLLPEYRDPSAEAIDLPSVLLSLLAILLTIYGLKQIAEAGPRLASVAVMLSGLAMGLVFVRRQRQLRQPLLDLALFERPAFRAAIAAYALSGLAMMGVYILITQHLQLVLSLSPLQAGFTILPWSVGFVIGSLGAAALARRMTATVAIVRCLLLAALGFLAIVFVGETRGVLAVIVGTLLMSLGLAPVMTLVNEIILTSAPPERAGAASAVSETSAEFSAALGIALLGTLGMALYRWGLDPAVLEALPAASREAALATLGATWMAAADLPAAAGEALLTEARSAFTFAVRVNAVIGAMIVLYAALLVARISSRQPLAVVAADAAAERVAEVASEVTSEVTSDLDANAVRQAGANKEAG